MPALFIELKKLSLSENNTMVEDLVQEARFSFILFIPNLLCSLLFYVSCSFFAPDFYSRLHWYFSRLLALY
jgi:hypothetical protein